MCVKKSGTRAAPGIKREIVENTFSPSRVTNKAVKREEEEKKRTDE